MTSWQARMKHPDRHKDQCTLNGRATWRKMTHIDRLLPKNETSWVQDSKYSYLGKEKLLYLTDHIYLLRTRGGSRGWAKALRLQQFCHQPCYLYVGCCSLTWSRSQTVSASCSLGRHCASFNVPRVHVTSTVYNPRLFRIHEISKIKLWANCKKQKISPPAAPPWVALPPSYGALPPLSFFLDPLISGLFVYLFDHDLKEI